MDRPRARIGRLAAATLIALPLIGIGAGIAAADYKPGPHHGDERDDGHGKHARGRTTTLAVIGDVPYGDEALARFGTLIDGINADPDVRVALHVGDTKSGSTECSDAWNEAIYWSFLTFRDPLVYIPGDNEWTDCHRANNGSYDPLERLDAIRALYFQEPGEALGGRRLRVDFQRRYPENQRWSDGGVTFATIHAVGSDNGLLPWTGELETPVNKARREAEWAGRNAANIAWMTRTFVQAWRDRSAGVALFLHADLYNPFDRTQGDVPFDGHQRFVEALSALAIRFDKPVVIISGDSHDYRVDAPADWISAYYGAPTPSKLTQIIVDRSIEDDIVWLRLKVDPRSEAVFSWDEVTVME